MIHNLNQLHLEFNVFPNAIRNYCKFLNLPLEEYHDNRSGHIGYKLSDENYLILKEWCEQYSKEERIKMITLNTIHEKYGEDVNNVMEVKEIKDKIVKTNIERYGVSYCMQNKEIQNKSKQTCIEKYGVDNPSKSKEVTDKIKQTFLEKYGYENCFQNEEIKRKSKETNIKKYGVPYIMQNEDMKNKIQNTNLEKYGSICTLHGKNDEKTKQIFKDKYGVENPFQIREIVEQIKDIKLKKYGTLAVNAHYIYNNIRFHSSQEIYFYIYHHDILKDNITRGKTFKYYENGVLHNYECDFFVNGENIEIKGSHLIDRKSMILIDFPDKKPLLEKTQCLKDNNVRIIIDNDEEMIRISKLVEKQFPHLVESCRIKKSEIEDENYEDEYNDYDTTNTIFEM